MSALKICTSSFLKTFKVITSPSFRLYRSFLNSIIEFIGLSFIAKITSPFSIPALYRQLSFCTSSIYRPFLALVFSANLASSTSYAKIPGFGAV